MENWSLEVINSVANSPSAYLILFITLLMYVLKTSSEREAQMREQLNRTIPILDRLVRDVELIKGVILNEDKEEDSNE